MGLETGYVYLLPEPRPEIHHTASTGNDRFLIDVAANGQLIGIEWLGNYDWRDALAQLALAGRLRLT